MDILEFDKAVSAATDNLIEAMRFEMKVYVDRMSELVDVAEKEKLPEHLAMASITENVKRLNAASAQFTKEFSV